VTQVTDYAQLVQPDIQRIAEEAKLDNTSAWLLSMTGGDLIRSTSELLDWGVYHPQSTIRIEKEDKTMCIDIRED
jgi:hypothetical protein